MTFFDQMKQIAMRVKEYSSDAQNEAQTISYLVYPFLKEVLGYDYASPKEVVREYGADIAGKKGEKVDIALLGEEGKPIILIEVKACTDPLGDDPLVQLKRYFPHTPARVCILTNGLVYKFYSEKSDDNKVTLDSEPFLEVNLLKYTQNTAVEDDSIKQLQKFRKKDFDVEEVLSAAEDLKYANAMKEFFKRQLEEPEEDFVKVVLKGLPFDTTKKNKGEKYGPHVKKALNEVIGERVAKRIAAAGDLEQSQLEETTKLQEETVIEPQSNVNDPTDQEFEWYYTIKTILRNALPVDQIDYRKLKGDFRICLGGSQNKWICKIATGKDGYLLDIQGDDKRYVFQDTNSLCDFDKKIIKSAGNPPVSEWVL